MRNPVCPAVLSLALLTGCGASAQPARQQAARNASADAVSGAVATKADVQAMVSAVADAQLKVAERLAWNMNELKVGLNATTSQPVTHTLTQAGHGNTQTSSTQIDNEPSSLMVWLFAGLAGTVLLAVGGLAGVFLIIDGRRSRAAQAREGELATRDARRDQLLAEQVQATVQQNQLLVHLPQNVGREVGVVVNGKLDSALRNVAVMVARGAPHGSRDEDLALAAASVGAVLPRAGPSADAA